MSIRTCCNLEKSQQKMEQLDKKITLSSYIPLIALSVLIIFFSLIFCISQIRQKAQDNIQNQLASFSQEADLKYSRAKYAAYQLSMNSLINDWLRSGSGDVDLYQMWEIQTALYTLTTSDGDIFSIDIYNNRNDSYLSTYDGYWGNDNILLFVNQQEPALLYKSTTSQIATVYKMDADHTMLSLVYPLPNNNLFGTVSINMPIDDFLQCNIGKDDRLFITNGSYSQIIASTGGTADTNLFKSALKFLSRPESGGNSLDVLRYSGRGYYVTSHRVFDNKYNIVYLAPALPAITYLKGYFHYFVMILIMIYIIGYFYSRFLCRLSRKPLSDIAGCIRNLLTVGPPENEENEFEYIQNSVAHLIDRNHENEKTIENYRNSILHENIKSLLLGRYFDGSVDYLKSTDLLRPDEPLLVIAFFSRQEDGAAVSGCPWNDVLREYHMSRIKMGKGYDVGVLRLGSEQDPGRVAELLDQVRKDEGNFIAGISLPIAEIDSLHSAYLEAVDALNAADDSTPVVCYQPEKFRKQRNVRTFPLEDGEILMDKLRNASSDEIIDAVSSIIDKKYRLYSPELFDAYLLYLVSCVSKVAIEFQLSPNKILTEESFEFFSSYETVDSKKDFLIDQVKKVAAARCNKQKHLKKLFIDSVENYIKLRFNQPISLTNIADDLHISSSYLSSTIKEELGVNFLTYVNSLRMKKATELLENSRLSIKEIGPMTGYDSEHSFIRNFKKTYHMTPSEYRNSVKRSDSSLLSEGYAIKL